MRLRLVTAAVLTGAFLVAAAPAFGAPSLSINGSMHLVVTGEGGPETFVITTVDDPGGSVAVTGPAGMTAPAGCTASGGGTMVSCPSSAATSIDLDAAGGDDTITLNDARGGSTATGGANDDTLNAGSTPLSGSVTGGPGNDIFNGLDAEADRFDAEAGNDTYHGGTVPAPASPGPDFDPATFQVQRAADLYNLTGATAGNISLDGTANDSDGQGGTDNVGTDVEDLRGADGNDTLSAGPNAVFLSGGAGDDTLVGSPEADFLGGDLGSDMVMGNAGDDELRDGDREGGPYDSTTTLPPSGNDMLDGGPGDDSLEERFGADDVVGGAGKDTAHVTRLVDQPLDPSATAVPNVRDQALTISLDDQANDGATGASEGDNIHSDVENVDAAEEQLELFTATDSASITVTGSAAPNEITTGDGEDTVDGGGGADVIHTNGGADSISAVDQATDTVNCGQGADSVAADLPGGNPARADVLSGCETVTGTPLPSPTFELPDSKAPKAKLSGATSLKAKTFLKTFTLPVGVRCDQACAVKGEALFTGAHLAKVGDLSIGSGSLKRGKGKRTLKVKIAKRYRADLRRKLRTRRQRRKGVKLTVAITVTNASGQSRRASRAFRVKG